MSKKGSYREKASWSCDLNMAALMRRPSSCKINCCYQATDMIGIWTALHFNYIFKSALSFVKHFNEKIIENKHY